MKMASEDKVVEMVEDLAKRDGDSDDAILNRGLESIKVDNSVIELDSSSDLNSSDCVLIADETEESTAKTIVSNDIISDVKQSTSSAVKVASKTASDAPAETKAIELADKSTAVVAEPSNQSESGRCGTVTAQTLEISSVAILECKNADSSVNEESNNVSENTTEILVKGMETVVAKAADETDSEAGAPTSAESAAMSVERPKEIDCEPSGSGSVTLLDAPEKSEQTAVGADKSMIEETIEVDKDLQEEVVDEALSELSKDIDPETHSNLDTPKKGDISIIDITTPPEKANSSNIEPACDGEKSIENVRESSVEDREFSELENVSEAPKTDEQSEEPDSTKSIESAQHPSDVVESDLETHPSVNYDENAEKMHETDVDGTIECMNIIADVSIAAESADAEAPATEKTHESSEVKENAAEKTLPVSDCGNIVADESIGDNGGTVACEEIKETHESPKSIENESKENESMNDSMERTELNLPLAETDAPCSMDVDEECEMQDECENKMDFEESNEAVNAVVDAMIESNKSDGNATHDSDEINAGPLDSEVKPESATEDEEGNALSTSVGSNEKSPDRALFIRVKSMAFLCSDGKNRFLFRKYEKLKFNFITSFILQLLMKVTMERNLRLLQKLMQQKSIY